MLFIAIRAMAAISVLATMVGTASATPLSGDQVKQLVNGNRIYLKIPFGGEFPLRYQSNGVVKGDGTAVGLGRFLAPKDEGRWWINNDRLCQQLNEWYDGQTACFVISDLDGNEFRWLRDDGRKGKGRVE